MYTCVMNGYDYPPQTLAIKSHTSFFSVEGCSIAAKWPPCELATSIS